MNSCEDDSGSDQRTLAHVAPFAVFLLFLVIPDFLFHVGFASSDAAANWYLAFPRQWIYPLQTLSCLAAVWFWRDLYEFRPHRGWGLAVLAGIIGILAWITPGFVYQQAKMSDSWWRYLGFADRRDGFDPFAIHESENLIYGLVIFFRFLRLVIVVPLVEEVFWRGFLMRIVTDPDGDYWKVPFGCFHWRSLIVVTTMFVLAHASVDYAAATIYGLLAYFVTVKTESLSAVIIMHAVANLLLGIYVMATQQWGYW